MRKMAGMITTRIQELARGRGFENAHQLQKATGLSSSMAARLFHDEVEGLKLSTIERLCRALGCAPGDLFAVAAGNGSAARRA